jgi:uncharacterized protein (DUF2141 family)
MKVRLIPVILFYLLLAACANIRTPSGGPKDEKPPVLLKSIPQNKDLNFKGKTVELNFNEAIKVNNPKEEIIMSPSPGKDIEIKVKQNKLYVTPKDGWKDSTTYTLLFREAVQDITENNSPINLKLAFSTGPTIDSLHITGKVEEILKGLPVEKITVAIYSQDTFDIFKHTPNYFTKTDKRGVFALENLKHGNYKIYAFDDKNKNLKVESRTERYGFISKELTLHANVDSLRLGLFMLDSRPLKITAIRNVGNVTRLRFNKFITEYSFRPDSNIVNAFGDNQTEINFWYPDSANDSIQLHLTATDSIENKIDSIFYIKKTNVKVPKERFKWSSGHPSVDPETGKFKTVLDFSKPVITLNFDSLFIKLDSVNKVAISKEDIEINTKHKLITVAKEIDKKIFKQEKDPELDLYSGLGFAFSIDGDSTKASTVPVDILWPEDAGVLLVEVQTSAPNFIIQLLDGSGNIKRIVPNTRKYTFTNVPPGSYQLRLVVDDNKNGKWDPGNISQHKDAEKVIFYRTTDRKQSFPIRANWELGPLIIKY